MDRQVNRGAKTPGGSMKKSIFLVLFVLMSLSLADAAEKSRIELADGSALDGEIVSFSDGKYTVNSSSLGTLQIEDSKVRAIHKGDLITGVPKTEVAASDTVDVQSEMQRLQPVITGNPEIMRTVAGLISDPDFKALLEDPAIMSAAKSLDVKALMANEKFVKAVNSSAVQEIKQKIKGQGDQT